jgi:formylglycine-generating enzyme required for sulfatase activity
LNNSQQGKIPLFVRLSQQKKRQPFDFLKAEWEQIIQDDFADALARGKVQILADGINELARDARREHLVDWRNFAQTIVNQGNQVIFSSRELDYEPLLNLPRVKIEALDGERILDYLKKHRVEALKDEMDINPQLAELASNPYYLSILVGVFHISKKVISNRGLLMRQFVSNLLKRERMNNHPDCMEDEIVTSALGQMAYVLQAEGENLVFDLAKAKAALPSQVTCKKRVVALDADALLRLGRAATLLDPGVDPDVRFYHQLLQEYFAANELLVRFTAGENLDRLWRAPTLEKEMPPAEVGEWDPLPAPPVTGWEVTTILACGICPDPEKLIQAVRLANPALAGRCLHEAGLTEKPENELLQTRQILLEQLYSPKTHLRARLLAGDVLGRIGDPRFEAQTIDGIRVIPPQMVDVPAGKYWIGSDRDDPDAYDDESKPFEVDLPAFQIGRWPVTNAEFACFINAGVYTDKRWWSGDLASRWLSGEHVSGGAEKRALEITVNLRKIPKWQEKAKIVNWSPDDIKEWENYLTLNKDEFTRLMSQIIQSKSRARPAFWTRSGWDNPSQPVTGITWFEASAFAAWLSAVCGKNYRLPDETEWEAAARGPERRIYPWGNEWDGDKANTIEGRVMKTTPVGAFAASGGIGPFGAEDQAGNVFEWTRSVYKPYPTQLYDDAERESTEERILRGGYYYQNLWSARGANRSGLDPGLFSDFVGFRLFSSDL